MTDQGPAFLYRFFRFVIARRWWIVGVYACLLAPAVFYALRVGQDNSLDRLIVQSDPDYIASKAFAKVFAGGEYALLIFEADDPYRPEVLRRFDAIERQLARLPRVSPNSALSVFRRAKAGFAGTAAQAAAFRAFVTGTKIFRTQGLVGERFLAIPLLLAVQSGEEREQALSVIQGVIRGLEERPAPFTAVRKVGQPYVNNYLDSDMRTVGMRYFPLFGLFIVVLILALYRSLRALCAFLIVLGTSVALTVGYIGVTGGVFTIVSALVPMTILITCTATLVYLHSRYVEQPPDRPLEEHHLYALVNKFLACTASLFAAAVGFAALAVSKIRPIREMGISVAVGMVFIWVAVFTLFPALQRILRAPTQRERRVAGGGAWFLRFTAWLPGFTYRWRWVFVPTSLALCVVGVIAIFGIPGLIKPMHLVTNAVEYINPNSALYKDTKRFEKLTAGLSITEVWLKGKLGSLSDPEVVRGLSRYMQALEREPRVGAVMGYPTILRLLRYIAGKGDVLPEDIDELEKITDSVELLLPREPMLQGFLEKTNMAQTHVMVITPTVDYEGYQALDALLKRRWREATRRDPALKEFTLQTVGFAPLTAKISHHLVPTLVESFGLTVAVIFGTFILIFRSGAARLMAMIPSLFAILVMFAFMRVTGMSLNVATIIIASTVLGATENDQIHYFYHFQEKRRTGTTEEGMRYTMRIAGRAIFYATMINASGFLAFAMADLPPIRQFGILSAVAFLLAMLADFTALPAALWMIFRQKPDALMAASAPPSASDEAVPPPTAGSPDP